MHDRDAKIDALLAKQEIWECLVAQSRATDRCDRELYLSTFHDGAILSAGPFVGSAEEMFEWAGAFQDQTYSATFHKLLQQSCDIDGDVAHTETYYLFVGCVLGGETNILAGGRYIDRFERKDGRWGMMLRNNFVEWTSAVPAMGNPLGEIADIGLNGVAAKDRSDASYIRPLVNRRARQIPG
jgi:hypothetical protein